MPSINVLVKTATSKTPRAQQVCGMFDVPMAEEQQKTWRFNAPIEDKPWSVGAIVGPSGSGKTTIARHMFGDLLDVRHKYGAASVIDDFDKNRSIHEIANTCKAVGFNTIPAWLRPYAVLSNGEQFRVRLARRLLEADDTIVMDEFTSVVDRQVAKIGSHAVQKHVRKSGQQFVAVSCHYDILDWLQPDWVIDAARQSFRWRSVQRRPSLDVEIFRTDYSSWKLFAPYHYLTATLNNAARCYVLTIDGSPAAFVGVLPRPVSQGARRGSVIWANSRTVTLPDYQGLGAGFALMDALGAAHRALGERFRCYPAHPAFIQSFARSNSWAMIKTPRQSVTTASNPLSAFGHGQGGRPCAVFQYKGPAASCAVKARKLLLGA